MSNGPARRESAPDGSVRDPTETLNYASLLKVCGSATNAFVNLADSAGLRSRRLLLLDPHRLTMHVVAEVLVDGRWIVVDPAFRTILRDSAGRTVTRKQLSDRSVFLAATGGIPGYDPSYTYDRTVHVRMARLGRAGYYLRLVFNQIAPGWEDSMTASLLLERESLATMVAAIFSMMILVLSPHFSALVWNTPARNTPAPVKSENAASLRRFLRFGHGALVGISSTLFSSLCQRRILSFGSVRCLLLRNLRNTIVNFHMTVDTKRYEIVFLVVPEVASGTNMMDLEILRGTTMLAAPAVAVQYLLPQSPDTTLDRVSV